MSRPSSSAAPKPATPNTTSNDNSSELNETTILGQLLSTDTTCELCVMNKSRLRTININLFDFCESKLDKKQFVAIELSRNQISSISPTSFRSLTRLEVLELDFNRIHAFPPELFHSLSSLTTLDLGFNELEHIEPGSFEHLINLEELYLNNNQLRSLPANFFITLANLSELYLHCNRLTRIEKETFDGLRFSEIQLIDLTSNELEHLDVQAFRDMASVELKLSNNRRLYSDPVLWKTLYKISDMVSVYMEIPLRRFDEHIVKLLGPKEPTTKSKETLLHELQTMLDDPQYFLDEYFGKLQNEVDLMMERRKIEAAGDAAELNKIETAVLDCVETIEQDKEYLLTEAHAQYKEELDELRKLIQQQSHQASVEELDTACETLKKILLDYSLFRFDEETGISEDITVGELNKTALRFCLNDEEDPFINPAGLINGKELELLRRGIVTIEKNVFRALPDTRRLDQLEMLSFEENYLTALEDREIFQGMTNLTSLNLSYNLLKTLDFDVVFADLTSLAKLNLKGNLLFELPASWPAHFANSLAQLVLAANNLTSIKCDAFASLAKLQELDISSNHIHDIEPDAFRGLSRLKVLDLVDNYLVELKTAQLRGLEHLENFEAERNLIKWLENDAFGECRQTLASINLHHNRLAKLEKATLGELPTVSNLELSGNKMRRIDKEAFKGLSGLVLLELSNNELTRIDEEYFRANAKLEVLRLNDNKLIELEADAEVFKMTHFKELKGRLKEFDVI